jgi:hypothetical protein
MKLKKKGAEEVEGGRIYRFRTSPELEPRRRDRERRRREQEDARRFFPSQLGRKGFNEELQYLRLRPVHFPKYFIFHPSHRIFGRMHGALNVGKK